MSIITLFNSMFYKITKYYRRFNSKQIIPEIEYNETVHSLWSFDNNWKSK